MPANAGENAGELECSHTAGGSGKRHNHFGTLYQALKKLNIFIPCESAIPLLGLHPRQLKTRPQIALSTKVYSSLICAKPETQMSVNRRMDKLIYPYNGELLSNKKGSADTSSNMDEP